MWAPTSRSESGTAWCVRPMPASRRALISSMRSSVASASAPCSPWRWSASSFGSRCAWAARPLPRPSARRPCDGPRYLFPPPLERGESSMTNFADVHAQGHFAADKMKKNNLFTTDRLFCDVYCFEPGQEQSPHSHSGSDKIYYVVEGTARISIGSEEREVGAGTTALAPAGV